VLGPGEPVAVARAEDARQGGASVTHDVLTTLGAAVDESHDPHSLVTSGGVIEVYDIQVDDQAVFFASGLLVHNCDICAGLEADSPYGLGDAPKCPAHGFCRCVLQAQDYPEAADVVGPYLTDDEAEDG